MQLWLGSFANYVSSVDCYGCTHIFYCLRLLTTVRDLWSRTQQNQGIAVQFFPKFLLYNPECEKTLKKQKKPTIGEWKYTKKKKAFM